MPSKEASRHTLHKEKKKQKTKHKKIPQNKKIESMRVYGTALVLTMSDEQESTDDARPS